MNGDPTTGWSVEPLALRFEHWIAPIASLMRAHETALLGRTDTTLAEAEAELRAPEIVRDRSLVVFDDDGVVGLRLIFVDHAEHDVLLDCWAHPRLRPEQQRAVMHDLTRDARELAAGLAADAGALPPVPGSDPWRASPQIWQMAAGAYRQDEVWSRQLERLGMVRVRTFQRMRLDHGLTPPSPPSPPAGVTVREARHESDLRDAWSVHQRAFADHWGGEPERDFDTWLEYQRSFAGFDPRLWSIAHLDGTAVALCAGSDARAEDGIGYVPLLGVLSEARGRGIARHLLQREFLRSARRGYAVTELTVDSQSLTGADRLYRSVGMAPTLVIDSWLRPIALADRPESG